MRQIQLLFFGLVLLVSACSSNTRMQEDESLIQASSVSSRPAVVQLYQQADESLSGGNAGAAEAALERALRIEPDNGYLWLGLAQVARTQMNYAKARDFAQRALSFAGSDTSLRKNAERLLSAL